eukprot:scaffold307679_cov23-Tisochrysis_lutea.AAC.1
MNKFIPTRASPVCTLQPHHCCRGWSYGDMRLFINPAAFHVFYGCCLCADSTAAEGSLTEECWYSTAAEGSQVEKDGRVLGACAAFSACMAFWRLIFRDPTLFASALHALMASRTHTSTQAQALFSFISRDFKFPQ